MLNILTCFPALVRAVLSGDLKPVIRHHGDTVKLQNGVDLGPCGTGFDTAKLAA